MLLSHAEAAFSHLAAAQQELGAIAGLRAGTLRLGTIASAGAPVVVPAISAFYSRYPEILNLFGWTMLMVTVAADFGSLWIASSR